MSPARVNHNRTAPPLASNSTLAVPLSLVTRLEEIDCKKIELSNGRHLVQYRGQLMPLVRVNDEARVRSETEALRDGSVGPGLERKVALELVEQAELGRGDGSGLDAHCPIRLARAVKKMPEGLRAVSLEATLSVSLS